MSDPNFRKIYFLITRASQYRYQQIPGNSPVQKSFATEIHGEIHPVSTCIPVTYLIAWYFTCNFLRNPLIPKLHSTSTRGLYHVWQTIVDYYLVDLVVQRALQRKLKSYLHARYYLGKFPALPSHFRSSSNFPQPST